MNIRSDFRVFLSYASEEMAVAEEIALALGNAGYAVFFDRTALPGGTDYNSAILEEIRSTNLMVVLVSPTSVQEGRYVRSELRLGQQQWPSPHGYVLPVMAVPTPLEAVPAYLRSVTILRPEGNIAAEVAARVADLASGWSPEHTLAGQRQRLDETSRALELMRIGSELEKLDKAWAETRKRYTVQVNDRDVELDSPYLPYVLVVMATMLIVLMAYVTSAFGEQEQLLIVVVPLPFVAAYMVAMRRQYKRMKAEYYAERTRLSSAAISDGAASRP